MAYVLGGGVGGWYFGWGGGVVVEGSIARRFIFLCPENGRAGVVP